MLHFIITTFNNFRCVWSSYFQILIDKLNFYPVYDKISIIGATFVTISPNMSYVSLFLPLFYAFQCKSSIVILRLLWSTLNFYFVFLV